MVVRHLALSLTTRGFGGSDGLAQKDFTGESRRLFEYVRDEIRYVKDIDGIETLHPAEFVARQRAGDCDDKSILLAALLLSIGHTPRFIAVAFDPDEFSHVWVQDYLEGDWVDLDPTEPIEMGQSVPLRDAVKTITLDV
jgi:transglutaminase-like putative cysteine protease